MQRDIYTICLKYRAPDGKPVRVIGTDHCNWALMQHQSRMAPYQDIATAQIIPSPDPWNHNIAFRAKRTLDWWLEDMRGPKPAPDAPKPPWRIPY